MVLAALVSTGTELGEAIVVYLLYLSLHYGGTAEHIRRHTGPEAVYQISAASTSGWPEVPCTTGIRRTIWRLLVGQSGGSRRAASAKYWGWLRKSPAPAVPKCVMPAATTTMWSVLRSK